MAFPESPSFYPTLQERFYKASLAIPYPEDLSIANIYTADGKLAAPYKQLTHNAIAALSIVPTEKEITVKDKFHPHPNSFGQYHYESEHMMPKDAGPIQGVLETYAYYLPPGKSTSSHWHEEGIEYYFLLDGTYFLRLNDQQVPLALPDSRFVVVGPNTEHQGMAGKDGALVMTVTHNPNTLPKDLLHVRHTSWEKDWEKEKKEIVVFWDKNRT